MEVEEEEREMDGPLLSPPADKAELETRVGGRPTEASVIYLNPHTAISISNLHSSVMPAVKRASSSTAGRPSAAKKPASGQAKIGFAARKGSSSSTAAAGSSKKPPQVAAAAVVSSEQQQPTRSSPRRKTKTKTKVDVVDLLSEDEQRASDEDEAALEALADLERRPSAASTPSAGRPKATPAGRAVETALEEGGELQPKDKRWTRCVSLVQVSARFMKRAGGLKPPSHSTTSLGSAQAVQGGSGRTWWE